MAETLTVCRACRHPAPYLFLPLGLHPPANMFVRPDDISSAQVAFPLNAQACLHCGLIQVSDQVPAGFFEHYLYVPSGAATMHSHFASTADILAPLAGPGLVVDVGCNDGLLLSACNKIGLNTLGVDPAANLAPAAAARGVKVHTGYFDPETVRLLLAEHGPAKVIITTNTFNHIDDLHRFMEAVDILLSDDGVFVVEVPWSKELMDKNEFDTIYHEHVSEFSLLSFVMLANFFDMSVVDVHRLSVHGGSMRVFMMRNAQNQKQTNAVKEMLEEELRSGIIEKSAYDNLSSRVSKIGEDLIAMLNSIKNDGKKIAGYGAPAKGSTLLNYFGIGTEYLDFLVDRNPLKHGLLSPGMRIPIQAPESIDEESPDVLLVLAWNFFDEIREQQAAFAARGGKFLVPLPNPVLV